MISSDLWDLITKDVRKPVEYARLLIFETICENNSRNTLKGEGLEHESWRVTLSAIHGRTESRVTWNSTEAAKPAVDHLGQEWEIGSVKC